MMQHADRLDQIESLLQRAEPHDVGLGIRNTEVERARLRHRIGEARPAEIDCERARALELLVGEDRVLPGSAARDENVEPVLAERPERRCGKYLTQVCVEARILALGPGCDPAR